MQVRSGRPAGRPHQADPLALGDPLAGAHQHRRHVRIDRVEAVAVVDLDIDAIRSPAGKHDLPAVGRNLGGSDLVRDIDAGVVFPEILGDRPVGRPGEANEMLAVSAGLGWCGEPCQVIRF